MEAQIGFLKELYRILRADGQIYLAIENRYALSYFQGQPEDHSGIVYGSLMPRALANMVSKKRKGKEYRTYTYSKRGYLKLLRSAGFTQATFYIPYPDYRSFDTIFRAHDGDKYLQYVKASPYKPSWRTYVKKLVMPYLCHSYAIVGDKNSHNGESWLDRFRLHLKREYPERCGRVYPEIRVTGASGIGLVFKGTGAGAYVCIPTDALSLRNNEKQAQNLLYIRNEYPGTNLAPEFLGQGAFLGIKYFVQDLIRCEDKPSTREQERCFEELSRYFASHVVENGPPQENLLVENVLDSCDTCSIDLDDKGDFTEKYNRLLNAAGTVRHPTHGDLWSGNMVKETDGTCRVIDWPDFEPAGLPLYDLFHFFIYTESRGRGDFTAMIEKACTEFPRELERRIIYHGTRIYSAGENDVFAPERASSLFLLYLYDGIVRRIRNGVWLRKPLEKLIGVTVNGPFPLPAFTKLASLMKR
jgi:thiamine kinase-like enzyme